MLTGSCAGFIACVQLDFFVCLTSIISVSMNEPACQVRKLHFTHEFRNAYVSNKQRAGELRVLASARYRTTSQHFIKYVS